MKSKRLIVTAIFALAILGAFIALVKFTSLRNPTAPTNKIKVTTSFYPMAEFARQVGGDKVDVTTMVKPGTEPHDYDPAPGDLAHLYQSRLFVYNGAGLEKWVDRVQPDLAANHITAVKASSGIPLRSTAPGSDETGADPHVWLDPVLAQQEVANIEAGLVQADPTNAAYYHDHASQFKAKLAHLDRSYHDGLMTCARRDIITSHQAFGYLGDRYHLDVLTLSGLSPDAEPTPQQLAAAAQFARDHQVKYIFFETLASPKLSETVAREVGAQTLVFNPLEGLTDDQIAAGANYLTVQQDNVNHLRIALDCK
jgi:zinc transport system substrate-binding protein